MVKLFVWIPDEYLVLSGRTGKVAVRCGRRLIRFRSEKWCKFWYNSCLLVGFNQLAPQLNPLKFSSSLNPHTDCWRLKPSFALTDPALSQRQAFNAPPYKVLHL